MRLIPLLKKSFRKSKYILLSVVVVSFLFGLLYFVDSYFTIKNIEVIGVKRIDDVKGIYAWNSKNILLFSEEELEKTISDRNPNVKSVTVIKKYPKTIQCVVEEYKPFASFLVNQGYFVLSSDGRILQKVKEKPGNLPLITYYQKLNYTTWQSGDRIEYQDLLTALYFLEQTSGLGLAVNTIDINGLNMIALQLQDQKILFTTEKDRDVQEYQLKTIIRQFRISGKNFTVLDLRFDKPVIQFTPT
jgi:cell division septal protein FtsQ